MPTVVSVQTSPRNPARVEVALEPRERIVIDLDAALRFGARIGAHLDEETMAAVRAAAEAVRVYDRAVTMLAFRARSARELEHQLVRKGEPAEAAAQAIAKLAAVGLLDDSAFARQFARSKLMGAGHGRARVVGELVRKGIERELAELAVRETAADEGTSERDVIARVAEKKLRTLMGLAPDVQRRRLYGFLARRGFAQGDILAVARALLG